MWYRPIRTKELLVIFAICAVYLLIAVFMKDLFYRLGIFSLLPLGIVLASFLNTKRKQTENKKYRKYPEPHTGFAHWFLIATFTIPFVLISYIRAPIIQHHAFILFFGPPILFLFYLFFNSMRNRNNPQIPKYQREGERMMYTIFILGIILLVCFPLLLKIEPFNTYIIMIFQGAFHIVQPILLAVFKVLGIDTPVVNY